MTKDGLKEYDELPAQGSDDDGEIYDSHIWDCTKAVIEALENNQFNPAYSDQLVAALAQWLANKHV